VTTGMRAICARGVTLWRDQHGRVSLMGVKPVAVVGHKLQLDGFGIARLFERWFKTLASSFEFLA